MKKTAALLTLLLSLLFSNQLYAVPVIMNGLFKTIPPTLQSSSPADNATNVTLSQNFTLTFDKNIMVGTGYVTIRKTSDNSIVEALDVTDATLLTISNTVVTLNPAGILEKGTGYYLEIDATAIHDSEGNFFEGFTGATTLNFTTVDVVINEVVTDPQIDWSTNGFDGTDGAKTVSGGVDEFVELFIKSAGIDFTGWTIELNDGSNVSGDLTRTGAFDAVNYIGTGTANNTEVGDYLVLGNVDGSGAMNNTRLIINLKDPGGAIVDAVAIGGGAGQAPSGNAASAADESVQRFLNGLDTDTDNSDFTKGPVTMGAANTGPSVTLTQSATTLAEAAGVNTITATLSAASSQTTTVEVGIKPDGSAIIINDFTLSTTSIVVTAGNNTGTATLTAVSDLIDEDDETIVVEITGVANGSENGAQEVTSRIIDDDIAPLVTLSVGAALIEEAGGSSTITATLSAMSSKDITVTLAYSGIATSGVDYNNTSSTTIVITAGNITANTAVGITAIQDANSELNETIIINIEEVTNGSEDGVQQQTLTIIDDDTPNVAFNTMSSVGTESVASANLGVGLSIASGLIVMVDYVVTGTAAGSGIDYTLNNGTLTFNPATTFENITIASIVDDAILEANETVIVTLLNPVNANLGANTVHHYTVLDNDEAAVTIADVSSHENDGAITLTATLDNAVQGGFTVDVNTADGTATIADNDYAPISDQTLIFTGIAGETQTFTVTPTTDIKLEADETIIVSQGNLAATSLGVVITDGAVLTVTNDDEAAITIADVSGGENDGAITLTATLDNAVQGGFTVDVNTADGTATIADKDYAPISDQTLTFTGIAGETQAFTVTPTTDIKLEADETIIVSQGNLAATSLGVVITDGAVLTVTNDDEASVTIADVSSHENDGAITLTATLDNAVQGGFTVDVSTVDGTATIADNDYAPISDQTLIFTGIAGETQTFTVTPTTDIKLEADETIIVSQGNLAATSLGVVITDGAVLTVTNDDEASVTIADVSSHENDGAITLTATLDNAVQGGFTVDVSTVDGTATIADNDYAPISDQTLTFTGIAGETQTFTVTPTTDIKLEADETIIVSQGNLAATSLGVVITDGAVLTVTNDDEASVTIADVSSHENDGAITMTATLDNAVQGGFTVDVNTADGTATIADNDYAPISDQTLIFTGIAGETQTFTVTPIADTKDENNETITIHQSNLASTSLGIMISDGATVNVINDDVAPLIFFGIASDAQPESERAKDLPISLSALSSKIITVDYAASGTATGDGTDYAFDNGTLTFNPGDMHLALQLTGIIDDLLDEENETIIITLSNPINAVLGTQTILTYTIMDNDTKPSITLSVSSNAIVEAAGSSTIMAMLSEVSGREVAVNLSYSGTAVPGTDYNDDASTNITISAGQLSAVAAKGIIATDDSTGESAETVIVDIQSVSNGMENGVQQQTIFIIDDDDASPPSGYTVNWGDDLIGASEARTTKFTLAGAEVGATYNYTVSSSGGGTNVADTGKITTATDQITLANLAGLGDGTLTLSLTLTDSSSNVGFEVIDTTILDQTAPSVPVVTRVSSDSGTNNEDAITNDNTPTINGTSDANSTIELFLDGSSTGTTTADGSGNWTLVYTGSSAKNDGVVAIMAKSTDEAGNTSKASTALLLIIDTTAPMAPAITSITTDSGINGGDIITNDQTLVFNGSAEANSTVEVFIDAASLGSVLADGSGNWGFDHTGTALADGSYRVTASATDVAGNTGTESIALGIIVDTVVPSAPIVDLAAVSDLGASNSDDLTSDNTPTIEGSSEANTSIELFVDEVSVGNTIADHTGSWRLMSDSTILNGVISLSAKATDAAGNTSAISNNLSITIDTNIAHPTLSPVDNATGILPDANLIITFSENVNMGKGNIVLSKSSDHSILETIDVTANAVNISGSVVTITLENNRRAPATEFYITIEAGTFTDDAGNDYEGISGTTDWSFTSIPGSAVSSVIVPTANTYSIGDSLEFTVNMVLPVTITGEVTIPVTIGSSTINATQVGEVRNSRSILFRYIVLEGELDLDGIAIGSAMNLIGGTMKDQFGAEATLTLNNVASSSTVLIDGIRPRPTLSATGSSLINKSYVTTFEYDEPVTGFELTDISVTNGIASNLIQVITGTKWRADITPIVDGGVSVTLAAEVATDTLGNTSVVGNSINKTFDGTTPEVISVTRMDTDHLNTEITSANFRVVFSENVLGVDLTDFEVALKGTVGALSGIKQVDAQTYEVTVGGISGEGTIGLNLKDDDSIIDNAANTLGGAGLANGDFIGDVYTTNLLPRAIGISMASIYENNAVGNIIGVLSSTDADIEDVHTYTIVSGIGDTDNGSFSIEGTDLKAAEVFDFETKESYSLRVKTDDGNGGAYEQALTITIDNVIEASIFVTGDASFDVSEIGRSHKRTLTLTNNGEKTVEIRVTSIPAGFSALPGSLILIKGASAAVVLTFIPTEVRTYNGYIIFNHEGGNEAYPVSGEGEVITSVEDRILKSTEILIFPNPVRRLMTLDLSALNGSKMDIEIVNVIGISMFTKEGFTEKKLVLDVSGYESGIYIVLFNNGRSVTRKKVMINNR